MIPCVASVSVGGLGAKNEERESKTARKMAQVKSGEGPHFHFLALVSFLARPKPRIPFLGLSLLRNQTETFATQAKNLNENVIMICFHKGPLVSCEWYISVIFFTSFFLGLRWICSRPKVGNLVFMICPLLAGIDRVTDKLKATFSWNPWNSMFNVKTPEFTIYPFAYTLFFSPPGNKTSFGKHRNWQSPAKRNIQGIDLS